MVSNPSAAVAGLALVITRSGSDSSSSSSSSPPLEAADDGLIERIEGSIVACTTRDERIRSS